MADIDVSAVSLASPPPEPYQQQYTPGILTRNNGLAATTASGYLQMWDKVSGVLLDTWTLEAGSISPGEEGTATADENVDLSLFDPGTELIFGGWVTCPGDQVPTNNQLQPTTVIVQEGESPDPPVVAAHSSQHEAGGSDQLDLSGLSGTTFTKQNPVDHAEDHEASGSDELNVTDLPGLLADDQTPAAHNNTRHLENYATAADLADHKTDPTPHEDATNLSFKPHGNDDHSTPYQPTSEKGNANGYPELDANGYVPSGQLADVAGGADTLFLRGDQVWASPTPVGTNPPPQNTAGEPPDAGTADTIARSDHDHGGAGGLGVGAASGTVAPSTATLYQNTIKAGTVQGYYNVCLELEHFGYLSTDPGPGGLLQIDTLIGPDVPGLVLRDRVILTVNPNETDDGFHVITKIYHLPTSCWGASMGNYFGGPAGDLVISNINQTAQVDWSVDQIVRISVTWTGAGTIHQHFVSCNIDGESKTAPA